jgi:hypothetical protein
MSLASVGTLAAGTNVIFYERMIIEAACVLDELWLEVTAAAGAGGVARMAVYRANENWQPTSLVVGPNTELDTTSVGIKKLTGLATSLSPGLYLRASQFGVSSPTVRQFRGSMKSAPLSPSLGASPFVVMMRTITAYAPWSATPAEWTDTVTSAAPEAFHTLCVISATD